MGVENRKLVYDSGKSTWFWICDVNDDIHMRVIMQLDHKIVGSELEEAWRRTMKVFPLLDLIPDRINDHLVFFEPDDESVVTESKEPVMPGTELARKRSVTLSYYDDSFTVLAFHSVMDGNGIITVARTVAYHYCCIHFGKTFDPTGFELAENREPIEYYKPYKSYPLGEYKTVPPYTFPENAEFFSEPDMIPAGPGKIIVGCLAVPVNDFIAMCKSHKANPASMLCIILARAAYSLHEGEKRDMLFHVTLDFRPALGITGSLAQCSSAAMLELSYDEAESDNIAPAAERLRTDLAAQRTEDYIKSFAALLRTYDMNASACSGVASYIGRVELGDCKEHIKDISLVNNACNILNMVQFGDEFYMFCQFGLAAERYMKAMTEEIGKLGVTARTVHSAEQVIPERRN